MTTVEADRRLVFLECVEATVEPFWTQLQERAAADSSPPANTRLDPYAYDLPANSPVEQAPAQPTDEATP